MPRSEKQPPVNLLIVEDNQADILLLEETFDQLGYKLDLHTVKDGEEALSYLYRQPPFNNASRPDLILLDMNLPRKNGFEVLAEIKEDETLKRIPVIVLSTSSADIDINRSYQLHANCFIIKPGDLDTFMDRIGKIMSFWLRTVSLPRDENAWKK